MVPSGVTRWPTRTPGSTVTVHERGRCSIGHAADVSRGVLDRAQEIARYIAARGGDFRPADPHRLPREAKSVEAQRPAKQCGVAVLSDVGDNASGNSLGSRVMRAAAREEFRGHRYPLV